MLLAKLDDQLLNAGLGLGHRFAAWRTKRSRVFLKLLVESRLLTLKLIDQFAFPQAVVQIAKTIAYLPFSSGLLGDFSSGALGRFTWATVHR